MTARRTLVTGAAGFVGANLVRRLLADGDDVIAPVRPESDQWRLHELAGHVDNVHADLRDRDAVRRLVVEARPEIIFHLAAHGAYSWQTNRRDMFETNVLSLVNLLDCALECGTETLVNAGSSSEYGFADHPPAESELPVPNSDYAVSKLAATFLTGHVGRSTSLRTASVRLYSVYGPFEDPRRLIPTLIANGLRGRLPPLANPATARDFVFVDDAVEALIAASGVPESSPGAVYNVGSGRQTSIEELVALARDLFGISEPPAWGTLGDRSWDTDVWVADPSRIRSELGWEAHVSLRDGIRTTADWMEGSGTREIYGVG